MKPLIFFLQIIFFSTVSAVGTTQNNQFGSILPETPKAESLKNFQGTFLGPVPPITQINVIAANGMIETLNQNTSLLNVPQDNPCLLRDEPKIKLCESLSCDLCMASDKCGWCGQSNKCISGNIQRGPCEKDCLSSWIFSDNTKCLNNVKSGNLNNIDPNATKMINPNIAEPKLAVNIINPDVVSQKITVKYGEQHINSVNSFTTNDGSIHTVQESSVKPMIGELQKEIVLNNKVDTKYVSLTDGKELKKDENMKTFGIDIVSNSTNSSNKENAFLKAK